MVRRPLSYSDTYTYAEKTSMGPPEPTSRTILLVEDDDIVRRLLRRVLEREGHEVLDAADAQDALRHLRWHDGEIDVLLTDLVLPGGMSGVYLAQAAPALRPEIKLLCMSGYGEDVTLDLADLPNGVAFIQKPFTPSVLSDLVRDLFGHADDRPTLDA
jgi:DNA-binding NtrC family response regulator